MHSIIIIIMQKYIETPRLILRDWKEEDIPFFARMNADPNVMEFFLSSLSSEESFAFYQRIQNEFQTCGFGLYAVERKEDHTYMGYTGLHQITFDVDFAPGIEIGWRLAHEYWGQGYAPEAATACLEYTRNKTDIKELFSFTSLLNQRSERVMQKIGMERIREFDHPLVPGEHPLCRHVLYHIKFYNAIDFPLLISYICNNQLADNRYDIYKNKDIKRIYRNINMCLKE